jgi:hypothetical protein
MNRSSRSRIRVVVSFIRFVYSKTPKRSCAFFMIFLSLPVYVGFLGEGMAPCPEYWCKVTK